MYHYFDIFLILLEKECKMLRNSIPLFVVLAVVVTIGFGSTAYAQEVPAPTITSPASHATITSNTFTVSGTSAPGLIIVSDPSLTTVLGSTVVAPPGGSWSVEVELPNGGHTIVANTFPVLGNLNIVVRSVPLAITVNGDDDFQAPAPAISITSPTHGQILTGGTVSISGTADPGTFVSILDLTRTSLATAVAGPDRTWSAEFGHNDGMHTFTALAMSTVGGVPTAILGTDTVTVFMADGMPTGPEYPVVTSPVSGASVPDNTFTVTGTSAPGALIIISDLFTGEVGRTVADADGMWSVQATNADGVHIFFAISVTGDSRPLHSDPFLVYVSLGDGPAPGELQIPTIASPGNGALIRDGSGVVISGTAAPNTAVRVTGLDIAPIGTAVADGSGAWSMTVDLADGFHTLTATSTRGSQESGHSLLSLVYVDSGATLQDRPVISSPRPISISADGTITISGTARSGADISIVNYVTEIATAAADGSGAWSAELEVPNGLYFISAIASTDSTTRSGNSEPVLLFINEPAQRPAVCR